MFLSFNSLPVVKFSILTDSIYFLHQCNEIKSLHPESDEKTEFPKWFLQKVYDIQTQKYLEFKKELSALSVVVHVNDFTYTSCIMSSVSFMILMHDA